MIRTAAFASALVLSLAASSCTTSNPDDDLTYDTGDGKADVSRPYGHFERLLQYGDAGFTSMDLREDHTYNASQLLVRCDPGACTDSFSGNYKFASSHGKTYIVLFNGGDVWYSFEYKMSGDVLSLRYTDTDGWFTMLKGPDGLQLDDKDNGGTFQVTEGGPVALKLAADATTGYKWVVTATDKTFGYPQEDYQADTTQTGGGGTSIFTWQTKGVLSEVGSHQVTLGYERPWEETVPPQKTFSFTVNVKAAQ